MRSPIKPGTGRREGGACLRGRRGRVGTFFQERVEAYPQLLEPNRVLRHPRKAPPSVPQSKLSASLLRSSPARAACLKSSETATTWRLDRNGADHGRRSSMAANRAITSTASLTARVGIGSLGDLVDSVSDARHLPGALALHLGTMLALWGRGHSSRPASCQDARSMAPRVSLPCKPNGGA